MKLWIFQGICLKRKRN